MSLINKMNVGNTNYDIQDRLMPDAIGQAGQVLKVKDDGSGLEFGTVKSGGGYYQHSLYLIVGGGSEHVIFYSSSSTAFTIDTLLAYVKQVNVGEFLCYYNTGTFTKYPALLFVPPVTSSMYLYVANTYGTYTSKGTVTSIGTYTITQL